LSIEYESYFNTHYLLRTIDRDLCRLFYLWEISSQIKYLAARSRMLFMFGSMEILWQKIEAIYQLWQKIQQQGVDKSFPEVELLAAEFLRSRRLCRPFQNQPLFGIYQVIYAEIKQLLAQKLIALIDLSRLPLQLSQQTILELQKINEQLLVEVCAEALTHERLKQLAIFAQQSRDNLQLRQYAVRELIEAIVLSDKIFRPHKTKFSGQFYELLYEEAKNQTLLYVANKIDLYKSNEGVNFMSWVNFRLDKEILNARSRLNEPFVLRWQQKNIRTYKSFYKSLINWQLARIKTRCEELFCPITCHLIFLPLFLNEYAAFNPIFKDDREMGELEAKTGENSEAKQIVNYISEDENGRFSKIHIIDRSHANFKNIALLYNEGYSWRELAEKFQIPQQTISDFYYRWCKKLAPEFKQYLEN
jgi:hypothetical protein